MCVCACRFFTASLTPTLLTPCLLSVATSVYPGHTCGAHLHAVDDAGATYTAGANSLQLQSLDNMLVSVGEQY